MGGRGDDGPWINSLTYAPRTLRSRSRVSSSCTIKVNGEQYGPRGTIRSASGRYIYVQLGQYVFLARVNRGIGHIDLSLGLPVVYAGEIQFGGRKKRGVLRWWNNNSGHYRPDAFAAFSAMLPFDLFKDRTMSP